MKVYNSGALSHRQRWWSALILGLAASVLIGIIFGYVERTVILELEIFFIAIGWLIGRLIRTVGHGVTVKFSVLAAFCALLSFWIGDMVDLFGVQILGNPSSWAGGTWLAASSLLQLNVSSLLRLLFRVVGIYCAYTEARTL